MRRVNGKSVIFIFFLALVIIVGLVIKTSVDTKTPVEKLKVGGLTMQFEEGVTEKEVKAIVENCNLTKYRLDYNVDMADKYYVVVENNKRMIVSNELKSAPDIKKGDCYIISLSEQAIEDGNVLEKLDKNNLQLKKFVWCYLYFGDGSKNWIPERDAIRIKNEFEMNETVLNVFPDYLEG